MLTVTTSKKIEQLVIIMHDKSHRTSHLSSVNEARKEISYQKNQSYHPHKMASFGILIGHCIKMESHKLCQQLLIQKILVWLWSQVIGCQCGLLLQEHHRHAVSWSKCSCKVLADANVSRPILGVHHSVHASAMLILTWTHSLISLCYLKNEIEQITHTFYTMNIIRPDSDGHIVIVRPFEEYFRGLLGSN